MIDFLSKYTSPNELIQKAWPWLTKIPGGNKIFSTLVGSFIPYTGSISPLVTKIENGAAMVYLKDHRAVRNHLDSIHAIALANLGEFTTGLTLISQLKENQKAILIKIEVEYLKKARGDLNSFSAFQIPLNITKDAEFKITADIKNLQEELVTKVYATWRVRPQ